MSDRAHLVLPYHKLLDAAQREVPEASARRAAASARRTRTSTAAAASAWSTSGTSSAARARLPSGVERANRLLELMGSTDRARSMPHVELLERLAPRLLPLAEDTGLMVHRACARPAVLLEGAQGSCSTSITAPIRS